MVSIPFELGNGPIMLILIFYHVLWDTLDINNFILFYFIFLILLFFFFFSYLILKDDEEAHNREVT